VSFKWLNQALDYSYDKKGQSTYDIYIYIQASNESVHHSTVVSPMGFDFSWWVFCGLRNKYTGKKGRGLGVVPCAWVGFFSRSPLKCTSKRM